MMQQAQPEGSGFTSQLIKKITNSLKITPYPHRKNSHF